MKEQELIKHSGVIIYTMTEVDRLGIYSIINKTF